MIDLYVDKPLNLEFQLDIDNNENPPLVFLRIPIDEVISFSIPAIVVGNIATIAIPRLEKYALFIDKKLYPGQLEVIADGRLFIPWEDTFSVIKEVKVSAAVKVEKAIQSKPMRVNLTKVEEIIPEKIGTVITLDKEIVIEETVFEKGSKIEILGEKQKGFVRAGKIIDVSDIRIEKTDYIKKVK